jgi:hypothetical protein
MGRKRHKGRPKPRDLRYGKKRQNNDLWFWLNLAMIDFCGLFGLSDCAPEEQPQNKEIN